MIFSSVKYEKTGFLKNQYCQKRNSLVQWVCLINLQNGSPVSAGSLRFRLVSALSSDKNGTASTMKRV